jgi:hypothetical protein
MINQGILNHNEAHPLDIDAQVAKNRPVSDAVPSARAVWKQVIEIEES